MNGAEVPENPCEYCVAPGCILPRARSTIK